MPDEPLTADEMFAELAARAGRRLVAIHPTRNLGACVHPLARSHPHIECQGETITEALRAALAWWDSEEAGAILDAEVRGAMLDIVLEPHRPTHADPDLN